MKRQERQSPETETAEGSKKTTKNSSGAPNAEFKEMTDMLMRLEKSIERWKKEVADAAKKKEEEERQKRETETIVTMVQVPENTLKVMEKIEKLNNDGWRRLKRFLATEETSDGAEGTKQRRACNQEDAPETTETDMPKRMQRALEKRKKEAFEMITRIDTELVKHALMNVGERFVLDKEGTGKVQTFEFGKTRIHTGKFEDLMNLWEKRTTGDRREEDEDSDEEERMDAEGSGEPHGAEECQMNMEVMDTHEEKKEENVRCPLRSTPIESRIDLQELDVDVFQYAISGWAAVIGTGTYTAEEIKEKVYADLNLDDSFKFVQIYVRWFLTMYEDFMDKMATVFGVPIIAIGASPPNPTLGEDEGKTLDKDEEGLPVVPLTVQGRMNAVLDEARMQAGRTFQTKLYEELRNKIGIRQGAQGSPGWWALPTPIDYLTKYSRAYGKLKSFGHIAPRGLLKFARDHGMVIAFGLELLPERYAVKSCSGKCAIWGEDGGVFFGIPPTQAHAHCGLTGPVGACKGGEDRFYDPERKGVAGDPFISMLTGKLEYDECFTTDMALYHPKRQDTKEGVCSGDVVKVRGLQYQTIVVFKTYKGCWVVGCGGRFFYPMEMLCVAEWHKVSRRV
ncbi:unnamed protein product [Notodromas monacha]|uniref:Uncharacterized protein n=1 Tax=Notodromas monacha TaxID=399045 RepID=A0A7R9GI63_9CRUS|nr:unnamed protein product [Notodromas monacha]CAG0921469.1 unnamed protein product [Notodromas monacha]